MQPMDSRCTRCQAEAKASPDAARHLLETFDFEDMGHTDCPEGCSVEPDGHCPHGFKSAGLTAGLI